MSLLHSPRRATWRSSRRLCRTLLECLSLKRSLRTLRRPPSPKHTHLWCCKCSPPQVCCTSMYGYQCTKVLRSIDAIMACIALPGVIGPKLLAVWKCFVSIDSALRCVFRGLFWVFCVKQGGFNLSLLRATNPETHCGKTVNNAVTPAAMTALCDTWAEAWLQLPSHKNFNRDVVWYVHIIRCHGSYFIANAPGSTFETFCSG